MASDRNEWMRAAVYRRYGGPEVVQIESVRRPKPRPNQVLIRVHATAVTSADWRLRSMTIPKGFGCLARLVFGVRRPRRGVLGTELSGVVADIGATVTRFKLGDEVIAYPGGSLGAHAEYFVMNENGVMAHKSPKISFEDAASLSFGGLTALFFLRDGAKIQPGEEVLVIGASGNVGSAAVQIAKHLGARVTAVCSGQNAELARSIGADEVIDYTNVDWRTRPHASFDVIFDTIGGARWQHVLPLLRPGGRLCLAVIDSKDIGSLIFARKKGLRLLTGDSKGSIKDLEYLNQLAERGEFRPVIQSVFSLNQIVEAHRVVDSGRKKGSVVVKLE